MLTGLTGYGRVIRVILVCNLSALILKTQSIQSVWAKNIAPWAGWKTMSLSGFGLATTLNTMHG